MKLKEKIALMFPGQGGQYPGMGKSLYENFKEARDVFDIANKIVGFDIKSMCFNGKEEELRDTLNSQIGILCVSLGAYEVLKKVLDGFNLAAGLSLGEYSALYAAKVLNIEDVIILVKKRALFMQDACINTNGTMVSILGLELEKVREICSEIEGFCSVANLNCPGQIVVSCDRNLVKDIVQKAREKGARRAIELRVAGAFHSEYMRSAAEKFAKELDSIRFNNEGLKKVVFNLTGELYDGSDPKELLVKQITNSVLWEKTINTMIRNGCEIFIELGPGKVLGGLLRRIKKDAVYLNVEDVASYEKTVQYLKS